MFKRIGPCVLAATEETVCQNPTEIRAKNALRFEEPTGMAFRLSNGQRLYDRISLCNCSSVMLSDLLKDHLKNNVSNIFLTRLCVD